MTEQTKRPTTEAERARRPYVKPQVLSRESLEAVAVVCSGPGAKGDPIACPGGPLNS